MIETVLCISVMVLAGAVVVGFIAAGEWVCGRVGEWVTARRHIARVWPADFDAAVAALIAENTPPCDPWDSSGWDSSDWLDDLTDGGDR